MPRGRAKPTLKPVAMPGQQYGQGVDAIQAQNTIPLPNNAAAQAPQPPPPGAPPPGAPMAAGAPTAQQMMASLASAPRPPVTPLDAPTGNPNEHVMTGVPSGPGPGPEILSSPLTPPPGSQQDLASQIRALYGRFPNPNLLALLGAIESNTPPPTAQVNSR